MPEISYNESGPSHLKTRFSWRNNIHRRCLAACLVQGVYSLERGHQRGIIGYEHASPWCEQFGFQLCKVLKNDDDSSYFGSIFKLRFVHRLFHRSRPKNIIAFRGTLLTNVTTYEDMKLNLKCWLGKPEKSSRFQTAFKVVKKMVETVEPTKVWLAGHSLGASIAMLIGRKLAKSGKYLETYLFNPPLISIRFMGRLKLSKKYMFTVLLEWKPHLFVNQEDWICKKYIRYFEQREKKKYRMIVPTAYMTVNHIQVKHFGQAHGIDQWWQPNNQEQPKLYRCQTD